MKIETLLSVVRALKMNIFEGFNINQTAKVSGQDPATAYRTLKEMESRNEVLKEKKGNNIFYKLNLKNSLAAKYCELSEIEGRKEVFKKNPELFSKIQEISKKTSCVVLFGSAARGEKRPADIDLLLLSEKTSDVKGITEVIKSTKISPLYMNFSEFKNKIKEKDPVLVNVLKDGKVLYGEDIYWKLLKEI